MLVLPEHPVNPFLFPITVHPRGLPCHVQGAFPAPSPGLTSAPCCPKAVGSLRLHVSWRLCPWICWPEHSSLMPWSPACPCRTGATPWEEGLLRTETHQAAWGTQEPQRCCPMTPWLVSCPEPLGILLRDDEHLQSHSENFPGVPCALMASVRGQIFYMYHTCMNMTWKSGGYVPPWNGNQMHSRYFLSIY